MILPSWAFFCESYNLSRTNAGGDQCACQNSTEKLILLNSMQFNKQEINITKWTKSIEQLEDWVFQYLLSLQSSPMESAYHVGCLSLANLVAFSPRVCYSRHPFLYFLCKQIFIKIEFKKNLTCYIITIKPSHQASP